MRAGWMAVLLVAWIALPGLAQEQDERRERDERRGQRGRGEQRRGQRGGMRQMQVGQVAERVAGALELDDEQRVLYDAILKKHEEGAQSGEEMREIFREIRAAREDGDQERVQELVAQIREQREAANERINAFFDEVQTILTDEQAEQLGGIRERMQQRGGRQGGRERRGERRGGDTRQMIGELRDELKLDPDQQDRFDELVEGLGGGRQGRRGGREGRRGTGAGREEIGEQIREAREAGDDERVQELREQMRAQRQGRGRGGRFDGFFKELESILRENQKRILAEYRERMQRGGGGGNRDDPRNILRAAKRLKLSDKQQDELKAIEREVTEASRVLRGRDRNREGRSELAAKLKTEIRAMLDGEQKEQFDRNLERFQRSGRRGGDRERGPDRRQRQRRRPGDGG